MEYISELQKKIVENDIQYKLINGCAGSRKTDTIIKVGIHDINNHKCNLLFLTLVSSVTDEIQNRLQNYLKIDIKRQSGSNHYMGIYKKRHIEIANFDAWIYKQLQYLEEDLTEIGSEHNTKMKRLLEITETTKVKRFCMKNNEFADSILIDEVQDLEDDKMNIIINILKKNKKIRCTVAGDYLQTIFERAIASGTLMHPMTLFKTIKPKCFEIDTCYRCPKAHIDFCNLLMQEYQKKYNIKAMKSFNKNMVDKPFLFTHGRLTNNSDARFIAEQVTCTIKILVEEKEIKPEDVAIIMMKSNNNGVFEQLKQVLNEYYNSIGYKNRLQHFNTSMDGYHRTINWSEAENKSVMLSIHGDKGKGHKVVFFLGLSHHSIPKDVDMYKERELLWQSLLNVGLTRSTQYLFVGFTYVAPSIYINNYKKEIKNYCYCSWVEEEITDKFYKKISKKINKIWKPDPSDENKFTNPKYRHKPLKTINKDLLRIRDDIAKRFEKPSDLNIELELNNNINLEGKKNINKNSEDLNKNNGEDNIEMKDLNPIIIKLGERTKITKLTDETLYPLIGYMAEIILLRKIDKKLLQKTIEKYSDKNNIFYTKDERLLNIVSDIKLNEEVQNDEDWNNSFKGIKEKYGKYLDTHINELDKPKYILNNSFNTKKFRENIRDVLSDKKSTEIESKVYWNISLLWNEIHQIVRRPYIYRFIDYFDQDINFIHKNVKKFIKTLGKDKDGKQAIRYQSWHSLECKIKNEKELKKLGFINEKDIDENIFNNGYLYGIRGFSDFYDYLKSTVIEIKASNKMEFSNEWLLQTLMYSIIKPNFIQKWKPKKIKIFNILSGKYIEYKLPKISGSKVIRKILKYYEANEKLVEKLIEVYKKNKKDTTKE